MVAYAHAATSAIVVTISGTVATGWLEVTYSDERIDTDKAAIAQWDAAICAYRLAAACERDELLSQLRGAPPRGAAPQPVMALPVRTPWAAALRAWRRA